MSEVQDLPLFPRWKQAVRDFMAEFRYGDVASHDWLADHFGMPCVDAESAMSLDEFRDRQFEWLANIDAFKHELLECHQVCLQSVRGEGYRWVPPHEQTKVATDAFERDARRAFRSVNQRLTNIRAAELNDDQRRQNVDALAKVSALRGMSRKALR